MPDADVAPGTSRSRSAARRPKVSATPRFVRAIDSPPTLFDMTEAYARGRSAPPRRTNIWASGAAVSANKCALRCIVPSPSNIPGGGFHQDGAFLGEGIRALNVWLALTDCGGDADVPGSTSCRSAFPRWCRPAPKARSSRGRCRPRWSTRRAASCRSCGPCSRPATPCSSTSCSLHGTGLDVGHDPAALHDRVLVLRAVAVPAQARADRLLAPIVFGRGGGRNRTHRTGSTRPTRFEDEGGHQTPFTSAGTLANASARAAVRGGDARREQIEERVVLERQRARQARVAVQVADPRQDRGAAGQRQDLVPRRGRAACGR